MLNTESIYSPTSLCSLSKEQIKEEKGGKVVGYIILHWFNGSAEKNIY